jgi:type IV pilus assembly protein PilP
MAWLLVVTTSFLVSFSFADSTKSAKNFFKDKSKIEEPFSLRDPFLSPPLKKAVKKENKVEKLELNEKGEFSNVKETPLDQISITEIKVVGVLIGKERRAMVNSGKEGSKVIILKEGMKIGPEETELKAILPGGIVLVEKITNVYGEEEFLETVIPISN